MAVQKSRKTPSKRGMHRSHDRLSKPALSKDPTTGETHLRHRVSRDGFYRGRKVAVDAAGMLLVADLKYHLDAHSAERRQPDRTLVINLDNVRAGFRDMIQQGR